MRATIAILLLAGLTSCKTFSGGPDAATTVNTVTRTYSKPADETWRSIMTVVKELDLRIDSDQHDALGGTLVATRSNKDEVHIEARSADAMNTVVAVSVEPGDKNLATIIQDRISERMGLTMGVSKASQAAGSQADGTYDQKLDLCIAAAEKAFAALKLPGARRELHDTWARVDTAHLDSIPVQIRMERTRKDQTFVVFTVGTGASDDNRTLAARLKTEFERHLTNNEPRVGGDKAP